MSDRQRYPSDGTDAQWALIGPFLGTWRAKRVSVAGRVGGQDLREIENAILYQNRTCCQDGAAAEVASAAARYGRELAWATAWIRMTPEKIFSYAALRMSS